MLSSSPEQSRRLDAEVADLLLAAVEETRLVRRFEDVARGLDELLLGVRHLLLLRLLGLEVGEDGRKVALVELLDLVSVPLGAKALVREREKNEG